MSQWNSHPCILPKVAPGKNGMQAGEQSDVVSPGKNVSYSAGWTCFFTEKDFQTSSVKKKCFPG